MDKKIKKLSEWLSEIKKAVFFGGAGVSTESGIPDFRSPDGIYSKANALAEKYHASPEYMLSHEFFELHTEDFYTYYRNSLVFPDAKPNAAHYALARLEEMGIVSAVITQNVDGLHTEAGSKRVFELHGSAHRNYCVRCRKEYPLSYIMETEGIPRCSCGGVIKPDVVLYDETLNPTVWEGAVKAVEKADMMIVGGTSLTVYPAAGLVVYYRGSRLAIINRAATPFDGEAEIRISGSIAGTLNEALDAITAK